MTKELLKRFQEVGQQEDNPDPLVIARYFWPYGSGTWYATEYDPKIKTFFGYVSLFGDHCDEWGYFSLEELEQVLPVKLSVDSQNIEGTGQLERDLHFTEKPISDAWKHDGFSGEYIKARI